MDASVFIEGKKYASTADASKVSGLSRDYVASLCKKGVLDGRQIGKQWYVGVDSLEKFILEQEMVRAKRREELVDARKKEYRQQGAISSAEGARTRSFAASEISSGVRVQRADRPRMLAPTSTYAHAALAAALDRSRSRATATARRHIPYSALASSAEFLHKIAAVAVALMFTVGTYAFVDAQYARITGSHVIEVATLVSGVRAQFAAVAGDPSGAFPGLFQSFARAFNARVNDLVYGIMFSGSFEGVADSSDPASVRGAFVSAHVVPGGSNSLTTSGTTSSGGGSTSPATGVSGGTIAQTAPQTVINNPIVERVIETERIVASAGGITEELLNERLNQLDNKFTSQLYSVASYASTPPASGGLVSTIALTNKIDQLNEVAITNSTFSGGDISGSSITGSSVSATTLSVSGDGGVTGNFSVGGTFAVTGTTTLSGFSSFTNASSTLFSVFRNAYFGGTATSTFDSTGFLTLPSGFLSLASSTIGDGSTGLTISGTATTTGTAYFAGSVGIGTTSPYALLSVAGQVVGTYFTATSTSQASTFPYASTTALTVSGTASTTDLFATLATITGLTITNSTTTNATTTNFAATGFTNLATTTITGSLTLNGSQTSTALTTTGNVTVGGNLTVDGNTITLGTTTSNSLIVNSSVGSHFIPTLNASYDIGSASYYWRNAYIGTVNANNLSAASTSIGGTASETFTLNSDNATADTQDMNLVFYRGTVVPNAVLAWDSTLDRFEFNQPVYISNESGSTTQKTFELKGVSGQTGDIFSVASSSGTEVFSIGADGSVTIATSTVDALTAGTSTLTNLSVTNTNTSSFAGALTVGGNFSVGGTFSQTGLASFALASTTRLSVFDKAYFGGTATTTIDSAGNIFAAGTVGIGTTTPWAKLALSANNSETNTRLFDISSSTASATTSIFTVLNSGYVGIGTTSPTNKFEVSGTSYFLGAQTIEVTSGGNPLTIIGDNTPSHIQNYRYSNNPAGPNFFQNKARGTQASPLVVNAEDTTFLAGGLAMDADGGTFRTLGTIELNVESVTGSDDISGYWAFKTRPSGSGNSYEERLRITSSGNVGIGTTTPWAKLALSANNGETNTRLFDISSSTASATTSLFTVLNSGYVGIGTSTPTNRVSIQDSGNYPVSFYTSGGVKNGEIYMGSDGTNRQLGFNFPGATGANVAGDNWAILRFGSGTNKAGFGDDGTNAWIHSYHALNFLAGSSNFLDPSAAPAMTITSTRNVGLGTSTPYSKLTVWGAGTGTNVLSEWVSSASTTIARILENGTSYFVGNVGVGTTTPFRRLSVTDETAASQMALSYDGSRVAEIRVDSTGDLNIEPSGADVYLNNDNFWVCTGGSISTNGCPSGTPTGQGNLIVENKFGVGTSTPAYKLTIETQDATTNFLQIASSTAQSLLVVNANGSIGVGTSTPFAKFTVGANGAITTVEKDLSDGSTVAISWLDGNQQRVTLGGNRTITFSNYIAGQILRLVVCQDATGSRTLTWPAVVRWQDGSAPTLTTTASQCDLVSFVATNATSSLVVFGAAATNF